MMCWYWEKVPEHEVSDPPAGNEPFIPGERSAGVAGLSLEAGAAIRWLFFFLTFFSCAFLYCLNCLGETLCLYNQQK